MKKIRLYFMLLISIPGIILLYFSKNKELIKKDIEGYRKRQGIVWCDNIYLLILLQDRSFRTLFFHRVGSLSFIIAWYLKPMENFVIDSGCVIEGGFYPAHSFSTIINAKKIGKNCSIRNNTTIGNKYDGRNDLIPEIGDNVFIGANSVIIGDIKIGNDCIIAAGSVVLSNMPDNTVWGGVPAKMLKMNNIDY